VRVLSKSGTQERIYMLSVQAQMVLEEVGAMHMQGSCRPLCQLDNGLSCFISAIELVKYEYLTTSPRPQVHSGTSIAIEHDLFIAVILRALPRTCRMSRLCGQLIVCRSSSCRPTLVSRGWRTERTAREARGRGRNLCTRLSSRRTNRCLSSSVAEGLIPRLERA
jgi:hypothetical protein